MLGLQGYLCGYSGSGTIRLELCTGYILSGGGGALMYLRDGSICWTYEKLCGLYWRWMVESIMPENLEQYEHWRWGLDVLT